MNDKEDHIAELIKKYLLGQLTDAESAQLTNWVETKAPNKENFDYIITPGFFKKAETISKQFNSEAVANKIQAEFPFEDVAPQIAYHRVHFLKTAWFRVAVAILLVAGIGAYLWRTTTDQHEITQLNPVPEKNDVRAGGNKATLKLADGSEIVLENAANGRLAQQPGANIEKTENGQIIYKFNKNILSQTVSYNTMSTPRGGQYQLALPDGSKVWLNAESSITFPTVFNGKSREVTITGEAYIEVNENKQKPFIVKTGSEEITVLGTSFNVNAYANEPSHKISLVEGAVRVNRLVLAPGQAFVNGKVTSTNLEQDIAWKNGYFNFEGADLKTVMRQISRWYDLEIVYQQDVPNVKFIGKMTRSVSLQGVLKMLEGADVNFILHNKTLTVNP